MGEKIKRIVFKSTNFSRYILSLNQKFRDIYPFFYLSFWKGTISTFARLNEPLLEWSFIVLFKDLFHSHFIPSSFLSLFLAHILLLLFMTLLIYWYSSSALFSCFPRLFILTASPLPLSILSHNLLPPLLFSPLFLYSSKMCFQRFSISKTYQ